MILVILIWHHNFLYN
ncbi:unnamed protein product, partial [Allacma fusca]